MMPINYVVDKFIRSLDPTDLAKIAYRLKYGGGHKKQAIAKAVGTSNKSQLHVIDATCGFGNDALVLAYLNCKVFAIEKNSMVMQFLNAKFTAAKREAFFAPIISNIQLFAGDCLKVIPEIIQRSDSLPDVIYLDPMFNHKTTAAPKKPMQILQQLLELENQNDLDPNKNLLNAILEFPVKKVVVKRPRLAAPLDNLQPNFIIMGKANRFDVYKKLY